MRTRRKERRKRMQKREEEEVQENGGSPVQGSCRIAAFLVGLTIRCHLIRIVKTCPRLLPPPRSPPKSGRVSTRASPGYYAKKPFNVPKITTKPNSSLQYSTHVLFFQIDPQTNIYFYTKKKKSDKLSFLQTPLRGTFALTPSHRPQP